MIDPLTDQFAEELAALEESGAVLPLRFKPSEACHLFAFLQLAFRHPDVAAMPGVGAFGKSLAEDIQRRLCKTPAMAEIARRGWDQQNDVEIRKTEEKTPAAEPLRGAKTEARPDPGKQSPKRAR